MTTNPAERSSSRRTVLLALILLLVLGGVLALRLVDRSLLSPSSANVAQPIPPDPRVWTDGAPRLGEVPEPRPTTGEDLVFPTQLVLDKTLPIRFQTDLDTIAPLGDGPENAALWFADFVNPAGARMAEYHAAQTRAQAAGINRMLLPDDPLLLEAEPWVDQATMRFFPDVWQPVGGWQVKLPILMTAMSLSRSWVARGDAAEDLESALVDYRRAIRLGRLIRQEDAIGTTDLIGLACIRIGLDGIYSRLIEVGDSDRALIVSLALGEHALQPLRIAQLLTSTSPFRYLRRGWFGPELRMPDRVFHNLTKRAASDPDRRFRLEAILSLGVVHFEGTREQRRESAELLDRLAADDDIWIANFAEAARTTPPDLSEFTDSR